jgi:hypothetical protein
MFNVSKKFIDFLFVFLALIIIIVLATGIISQSTKPDEISISNKVKNDQTEISEIDTSNWETFYHEVYKFQVKHPSKSKIYSKGMNPDVPELADFAIYRPEGGAIFDVSMRDAVKAHDPEYMTNIASLDLESYVERIWTLNKEEAERKVNNVGTPLDKKSVSQISQTIVDGLQAYQFTTSRSPHDETGFYGPYEHRFIFFEKNDVKFIIDIVKDDALSEKVLESFEFIEQIDTSTWQTYRNEGFGFSFEYPEEWLIELNDNLVVMTIPNKEGFPLLDNLGNVTVKQNTENLEDLLRSEKERLKSAWLDELGEDKEVLEYSFKKETKTITVLEPISPPSNMFDETVALVEENGNSILVKNIFFGGDTDKLNRQFKSVYESIEFIGN